MKRSSGYTSKQDALVHLQRYCAYQDRCHAEVRSKLLSLKIYGDDLEEIITELVKDGFLDEERYARAYVRGKFRNNKWGKLKIRQGLQQKRISEYLQKKAMEEIDQQEYESMLSSILQQKMKTLTEGNSFQQRQKLVRYAVNKGFEMPLVLKLTEPQSGPRTT